MTQTATQQPAQPPPDLATVADVMRPPLTTADTNDHLAAAAVAPVSGRWRGFLLRPEMLRSALDRAHLERADGRSGCAGLLAERAGRRLAWWG